MDKTKLIEDAFEVAGKLPTLPGIAVKILDVVKRDNSDFKEIADIISSDPPLSAEVLKTVNSPLYNLPSKVSTVPRAVSMLGINAVKNLALSFSLMKSNNDGSKSGFDYTAFWKNSLIAALTSKLLAQKINPDAAEDAFFVGLLHDIGILSIVQCLPKQYSLVLQEMAQNPCGFHEAETLIFGFDHAEVGEYFTRKWGFPEIFSGPIRYHHYPDKLNDKETELARAKRYKIPISLIFADIDYFKQVNDTYGHLAGDHALRIVSKFLQDIVRTCDTVARYGGEEFGIILPETPLDGAVVATERIRKKVPEQQIEYEDKKFTVTLSFGVVCFTPGQDISKDDFLNSADKALYEAKLKGRNRLCVCKAS